MIKMNNMEIKNNELRADVDKFREDNFNISWSEMARRANISIPYMLDWKDERRDFGEKVYNRLRTFIDDNTK